jgi:hypothetical protein
MTTVQKARWKIEVATGDREPHQTWIELHGYGKRYRFAEKEDAERELERFTRTQPEAKFRIVPM